MANERKTEAIVRRLLEENGYYGDDDIIIEEQSSDNPKIDQLLRNASKSGKGRGYPEFIISFVNKPDNLIVIECKADTSKHKSDDRKQYRDFAVDGVLLYASELKDKFNVVAIAVSGETLREVKISHFLWLKNKRLYKDVSDQKILNPRSLFNIIREQSKPLREEELVKKAIAYNKDLHDYSIPEVERCTLISSILVALQDDAFADSYKKHHQDADDDNYNPNESLINALLTACENVLKRNGIPLDKREVILGEYDKMKHNYTFKSKFIQVGNKREKNTVLRGLIDDLNEDVFPYVSNDAFDILGKFYTQFIRYAGSDQKTGLVLTPTHITDLFCELAELSEYDKVFDPCCGTGGFLVSAMNYMSEKSHNDSNRHNEIKTNQILGIEQRSDMFSHVCSNMMMRGDGKSQIYYGDCFDQELKNRVADKQPNKVFLNPPYDGGPDRQLEFVEHALECMSSGGLCIAICQTSTVVSSDKESVAIRKRLMKDHTLLAVLSMPDSLFHPVGVVTCIIVFQSGTPHPENKETFFGYFRDDGYMKIRNKGRVDPEDKWPHIKEKWLSAYANTRDIPGLSIKKKVKAEDEWCAEAYMPSDYSSLSREDFSKIILDYSVFLFQNRYISQALSDPNQLSSMIRRSDKRFRTFVVKDVLDVDLGRAVHNNQVDEGNLPYITRTAKDNGTMRFGSHPNSNEGNALTLGAEGYVSFYQPRRFITGNKINIMRHPRLNVYNGLFLCAILNVASIGRYNYGYAATKGRIERLEIELPVDPQNGVDWKFMEDYIKSLPYSFNLSHDYGC